MTGGAYSPAGPLSAGSTERAGPPGAFALAKRATIRRKSRHTPIESDSVVAVLEGSDLALRDEYVVYTAHIDHLGVGPVVDGDAIYNGALDNAAGTAVVLEDVAMGQERPEWNAGDFFGRTFGQSPE